MAERKISSRKEKKYLEGLLLQQSAEARKAYDGKKPAWIGIDWGQKWSGIALSPDGNGVFSHSVTETHKLEKITKELIKLYGIVHMAIGISYSSTGDEAPQGVEIREFADGFVPLVQVHFVDERNTTIHRSNERTDDAAAALILQYGMRQVDKLS